MSTKSSKKQPQRLSIRTRTREEDDSRVSSLPDSILCHILSFLPTKEAFATTILSKRWKPLCLSVSTLDFDFNDISRLTMKTASDLSRLVNSVMLSRHNTLPIQTFRLKCCPCRIWDADDIIELIISAIQRRTQTLELNMMFINVHKNFVSNLFTCRTLTVLKLKNLTIWEVIPQINNNISQLKTLYLETVCFVTHTHLINFLLSFPLLEELEANDVLITPPTRFVPKKADKIKCLRNLVTAKLSDQEQIPLFLLSRALTSLSIKITWPCFVHVPVFYNLTQMEIFSDLKLLSWPKKWMWILEMLQNTPKLQHLIIHEEIENGNNHEEYSWWEDPKIAPECLSSQLKTCLFRNYRGNKCELRFAEYVMRSSKVLINMTIHCACDIDLINAKFQMLHKLCRCPRECKVVVFD
ncbi:unnamed protein product [Trifolium pratense]|uniref:Uncharacterized protein n=1 Tax=Trifolium pratense TaxID=57577 RepID=A0ACB0L0B1_TRIPR|nr:unnamed protein product [Trifolium pratense]